MQAASLALPVVGTYLPAAHAWHVPTSVEPTVVEYFPIEHSTQSVCASLPLDSRYVPAMQSLQTDTPCDAEYLPFSQDMQSPSSSLAIVGKYLPALQSVHVDSEVAPVSAEYLPVPHVVHVIETMDTENLPASQKVQVDEA